MNARAVRCESLLRSFITTRLSPGKSDLEFRLAPHHHLAESLKTVARVVILSIDSLLAAHDKQKDDASSSEQFR